MGVTEMDFSGAWLWPTFPEAIDYTNLPCTVAELDGALISEGWITYRDLKGIGPMPNLQADVWAMLETLDSARGEWSAAYHTGNKDKALLAAHFWHRCREQMDWHGVPTRFLTYDQWVAWDRRSGGDCVVNAKCFVSPFEIQRYLVWWALRQSAWARGLEGRQSRGEVVTSVPHDLSRFARRCYEVERLFLGEGKKMPGLEVTPSVRSLLDSSGGDMFSWDEALMHVEEYTSLVPRLNEMHRLAKAGTRGVGTGSVEDRAQARETKVLCSSLVNRLEGAVMFRMFRFTEMFRTELDRL